MDSKITIPTGALICLLVTAVLTTMFLTTLIFEHHRPKVVDWKVTILRSNSGNVITDERPARVVWEKVVYECTPVAIERTSND